MTRRLLETTTAIGLISMVAGMGLAHAQDGAASASALVSCVVEQQPCPAATDAEIAAAAEILAQQAGITVADAEARIRAAVPADGNAGQAPVAETPPAEPEPAPAAEAPAEEAPADADVTPPAETETAPAETEEVAPPAETETAPAETEEVTPPAEVETAPPDAAAEQPEQPDALDEAMQAIEDAEKGVEQTAPEADAEAGVEAEVEATSEAPSEAPAQPTQEQAAEEPAAETGQEQPAVTPQAAETEAQAEPAAPAAEAPDDSTAPAETLDEAMGALRDGEQPAEAAETQAPATVQAEADADPAAVELSPEQRAAREERRAQRQAARSEAAALEAADEGVEADAQAEADVQIETVTEQTARSSDEPVAVETTAQQDTDQLLRNILGVAAGVAVGAIIADQFNIVEPAGDRVVVERDGELFVLRDENELLRRPGTEVRTRTFEDGSTRTVIIRENGARIVTIRAADGTILYRARVAPDGRRIVLIDERQYDFEPVDITRLPAPPRPRVIEYREADTEVIRSALTADLPRLDRRYSLQQVRDVRELRALAPGIDLAINFATGSAAVSPSEAETLTALGRTIEDMIAQDPNELFLVEGHTDTVGAAAFNLALSDRRAESVALALTEYFDIPPENLVTQGYGERFLKVEQIGDVRENRRAVVRRITPLVRAASAQ